MGVNPASSAAQIFLNAVCFGLAEIFATLAVRDDHPFAPGARSMPGGDFAGEGSFRHPVHILRADLDSRALARCSRGRRFTKGGQITISAWVDSATSGRNFSKNATVSDGVLYIFQLPAMMGRRIGLG